MNSRQAYQEAFDNYNRMIRLARGRAANPEYSARALEYRRQTSVIKPARKLGAAAQLPSANLQRIGPRVLTRVS